ncbi:hypothetical protein KIN20_035101, partial [Parelaphostrongylus tenuis]
MSLQWSLCYKPPPCPTTQSNFVLYCVNIEESEISQRAAVDEINEGKDAASKPAAGRRFQCFNAGDLDLGDKSRSRGPTKLKKHVK